MTGTRSHSTRRLPRALVRRQHQIFTRDQLLELGYSRHAIDHRLRTGRLYRLFPAVYSLTSEPSRHGRWLAAVYACGAGAALSHEHAAVLWGLLKDWAGAITISVPRERRLAGIRVRRRSLRPQDLTVRNGIPATTPICTLVDLAARHGDDALEQMINEADVRGLCTPPDLRAALEDVPRRPGVAILRRLLDRRTFRLTRSRLERLFIPIALRAGLPPLLTRQRVNGVEVDFYFPELGLVVETDGLTYHRTPQQQAADLERDQLHFASDLTPLRFTHWQVRHDPGYVGRILRRAGERLTSAGA
jgi:very-short-patch-repair endonuclease